MGQARIRKLNGTYPTKAQIAAMELERLRNDLDLPLILQPSDLKLPDVPEAARESVRAFLAPLLPKIPVKNGDCWNIAQKLMMLANNPRVGYVEGVWTRVEHHREHERGECDCEEYKEDGMFGAPHAWNTVDGYLVDLSVENKFRVWTPEDAEWNPLDGWWHEAFKEYTLAEIHTYLSEVDEFDGFSITVIIADIGLGEDFGFVFTDEDRESCVKFNQDADTTWEEFVFKPVSDRLQSRYLQAAQEQAVAA